MSISSSRARWLALTVTAGLVLAGCASSNEGDESTLDTSSDDAALVTQCWQGPTVKGIDVSTWQSQIDWDAVRASGVELAITRVSDGGYVQDPRFAENWAAMKRVGMVRGVYQYFRASQDPNKQADLLLAALASDPIGPDDLPVVVDIETTDGVSSAKVVANMTTWMKRVEAGTGKRPLVYTAAFMSNVLGASFSSEPLWVANYGRSCPLMPAGWSNWAMWQYSSKGKVPGIHASVDLDVFQGTKSDLLAFARGAGPGAGSDADAGADH